MHPYSIIDTTAAWKKLRFILSVRSDFHMIDSLSIVVHAFVSHVSMSFWTLTKRLEKGLTAITQECCGQYWTSLEGNTPQSTNYTATYLPSRKLSKLDEPDTQFTAGEAGTNSWVMYSYGPPTYGRAKAGRLARTYIQQLCEDTGCSPEDLPEVMNDWEKWRERVRDIRAGGTTWSSFKYGYLQIILFDINH